MWVCVHTISLQVVRFIGPAGGLGGVVGGRGISSSPSSTVLGQEVSQGEGLPLLIPLLFSCCYGTQTTTTQRPVLTPPALETLAGPLKMETRFLPI